MRFEGTSGYVATEDLKVAVNAAITLERPLLVTVEEVVQAPEGGRPAEIVLRDPAADKPHLRDMLYR